jgi:hypothetical protein
MAQLYVSPFAMLPSVQEAETMPHSHVYFQCLTPALVHEAIQCIRVNEQLLWTKASRARTTATMQFSTRLHRGFHPAKQENYPLAFWRIGYLSTEWVRRARTLQFSRSYKNICIILPGRLHRAEAPPLTPKAWARSLPSDTKGASWSTVSWAGNSELGSPVAGWRDPWDGWAKTSHGPSLWKLLWRVPRLPCLAWRLGSSISQFLS